MLICSPETGAEAVKKTYCFRAHSARWGSMEVKNCGIVGVVYERNNIECDDDDWKGLHGQQSREVTDKRSRRKSTQWPSAAEGISVSQGRLIPPYLRTLSCHAFRLNTNDNRRIRHSQWLCIAFIVFALLLAFSSLLEAHHVENPGRRLRADHCRLEKAHTAVHHARS